MRDKALVCDLSLSLSLSRRRCLQARQDGGADLFIGYGGVHVREKVLAGSDWYVMSFEPLIAVLE